MEVGLLLKPGNFSSSGLSVRWNRDDRCLRGVLLIGMASFGVFFKRDTASGLGGTSLPGLVESIFIG
jgi:hypothetical protein